jgi:type II secretory pathway pseudopilin PulG
MYGFCQMKKSSKGFSLLELLFSVGIMSLLLTGMTVIFNNWFKDSIDLKVGQEMQKIILSAKEYVGLNFDEIIRTQIPNEGDTVELDIDDLIDQGFLPASFTTYNSFKQRQRIFIHHLSGATVNGTTIEVIALSDELNGIDSRKSTKRLFNAATKGGPSVGVLSNLDLNVKSSYGTWAVPLSRYTSLYTNSASVGGGYMAAHALVSIDSEITGSYLYRSAIAGAPELNRMETNIDMSGNSIDNAGSIIVDSTNVGGNAVFNASGGATSSPYILAVEGDLNARNLRVNYNNNESKGNIIISGDDTIGDDFIVNGSINVSQDGGTSGGTVISNSMNSDNITASGNSRFNSVDLNNASLSAGNIYASTIEYSGSMNTTNFQASQAVGINNLSASSAIASNTNITSANGLTINNNRNVDVSNGIAVRGNATINNLLGTNEVSIQNMASCGSGCP